MKYFTREYFEALFIRCLRTFGTTMASFVTVGSALQDINWGMALSVSLTSVIWIVMISLKGLPEVNK